MVFGLLLLEESSHGFNEIKLLINKHMDFLNQNAGGIQALSTIVLVLVTVLYARSTRQMAMVMKDQITSKIIIENYSVGSRLIEKWFIDRGVSPNTVLNFQTLFDVRNEGNASGSIYKPDLIISSIETGYSLRIGPKTKTYETYNYRKETYMTTYDTRIINNGASIFLSGGESNKIELEYEYHIKNDGDIAFVAEALKDPSSIQYSLVTLDNLGKEYKIIVTNIKEEKHFGIN